LRKIFNNYFIKSNLIVMTDEINSSLEEFLYDLQYNINAAFLKSSRFSKDRKIYSEKELEENKLSKHEIIEMINDKERMCTCEYEFCWRSYICRLERVSNRIFRIHFTETEEVADYLLNLIIDIPRLMFQLYNSYEPIFIRTEDAIKKDEVLLGNELEKNIICGLHSMQLFKESNASPELLNEIDNQGNAMKIETDGKIFYVREADYLSSLVEAVLVKVEYAYEIKL